MYFIKKKLDPSDNRNLFNLLGLLKKKRKEKWFLYTLDTVVYKHT